MFPTESFKILPGCSTVATCSSDELLRMYLKMHSEGEFCEEVEWIEDRRRYVIMSLRGRNLLAVVDGSTA